MFKKCSIRSWVGRAVVAALAPLALIVQLPQAAFADTISLLYIHSSSATGVVEVHPKVYLVFWGSQWSTDPSGVEPVLQKFFQGLYGSDDTWGQILDQYCEGVSLNTTDCGSSGTHIVHPGSSPLAGVWFDNASPEPSSASKSQLTAEVKGAAAHFGNTTPASNLDSQYVIASPHGTTPGLHPGGSTCAYHKSFGAGTLGELEWTNLPYLPDWPSGACAIQLPNATLVDRYTIVESHEYAESVTDVTGGWRDAKGDEIGDKCEDKAAGDALETLRTGTFAVQAIWSNQVHGCATTAGPPIWNPQATHPQALTNLSPALAYFGGKLYAAWVGVTGNAVYYSAYNGKTWATQATIQGSWGQALTNEPPALVVVSGVLYAAWRGDSTNGAIFYSTTTDGTTWSPQATISGTWGTATTSGAPALGVNRNVLFVAYKGKSNTNVYFTSPSGGSWQAPMAVPGATTEVAPAVVGTPNAKYSIFAFAWTTSSHQIDTDAITALGWASIQTIPSALTEESPSVARLNSKTLVFAYKGTGTSTRIFYDMSFGYNGAADGFSKQLIQPQAGTNLAPAIATTGDTIAAAWRGTTSSALFYSTSTRPY
jgi:serine protease